MKNIKCLDETRRSVQKSFPNSELVGFAILYELRQLKTEINKKAK
jgi:hypothetical protein